MAADRAPASAGSHRLPASIGGLRERVDRALEEVLDDALRDAPGGVAEPVRYAVLGEGKRIRPTLLVAGYRAADGGDPPRDLFRLSCSVELVHAYSLIHDDLPCMDDDDLRRGRPALHVRGGGDVAVFTGAVLMPLAVRIIVDSGRRLSVGEERTSRLVSLLTRAAGASGMVGGQLRDLEAEGERPDREALETIYRGKTAALISASVAMGGVAAGAGGGRLRRLEEYGRKLGLAFQIVDDVLDLTASERELGKPCRRDVDLEKATYPALFGLEEARRRSRRLAEDARDIVDGLPGAGTLRELAEFVVERGR
mgnify:CR=1 FL=1